MPAKWMNRSDRWQLEAEARRRAEKIGLSPDHVLELLDLNEVPRVTIGIHDAAAAEIDRQLRTIALDRPDLVRPGAPLPFSAREIHDHWEALIAQGRTREAETFGKRHSQAIAEARPIAMRERQAAHDEAEQRERLAYRRLDKIRRARYEVAEEQSHLDHVTRGEWPHYMTRQDAPPTARHVMDSRVRLGAKQAVLAQLEAEDAAAKAAAL